MDEKMLIEMTKQTVDEMDRILRMDNTSYLKEFGCESDRADKAKIEKTVNMITTLKFFIDQYYMQQGIPVDSGVQPDEIPNNNMYGGRSKKSRKNRNRQAVTPLYE